MQEIYNKKADVNGITEMSVFFPPDTHIYEHTVQWVGFFETKAERPP
jgi:hypothetical protein